jgi:hypothetical protein
MMLGMSHEKLAEAFGERPKSGIVGVERHHNPAAGRNQHGIANRPGEALGVDLRRFEWHKGVEATDNVAGHHLFSDDLAFRDAGIRGFVPFFSLAALSTQLGYC